MRYPAMNSQFEHQHVDTNGVKLHVVQAGPKDGPLVILLHGFPEFWRGWRYQIPYLAERGYQVWAPDQRGYNLSERPAGIDAYDVGSLADDVVGLIDAAGRESASLVGHDWGGAVAWWVARVYPQRLSRLIILNVPHGSVMSKHLRTNPAQRRRSLYMRFFQIPRLPEALLGLGNWWVAAQTLRRTSRPGTFSKADLDLYRQAWSHPGAMTAMLNWYRALPRFRPERRVPGKIQVPTLLIWGAQDVAFERDLAPESVDYCEEGQLVMIEKATHWVQHEEPERVNELIVAFLAETAHSSTDPRT